MWKCVSVLEDNEFSEIFVWLSFCLFVGKITIGSQNTERHWITKHHGLSRTHENNLTNQQQHHKKKWIRFRHNDMVLLVRSGLNDMGIVCYDSWSNICHIQFIQPLGSFFPLRFHFVNEYFQLPTKNHGISINGALAKHLGTGWCTLEKR